MASVERVGLLDRYASLGCLKDHVELVGIPHAELLTDKLVLILMIREIATHKAALSNVGAILCEFKKIDIAKIFSRFSIKNEPCQAHFSPVSLTRNQRHFGTDDGGTLTVEGDLHAVGFNNDRILDGCDGSRNPEASTSLPVGTPEAASAATCCSTASV